MILVADAHVSTDSGDASSFDSFLSAVSGTSHDVLFLGDIFDLWVGFPRYERAVHRRFLGWCSEERGRRAVGYIEGNHEYFVSASHGSVFTMCDREQLSFPGGILAVHGDAVDREDRANLRFRRLSNSVLSYWVLRLMPGGPRFASWVKRRMHVRRAGMTSSVPEAQLQRFAEACFARGTRTIFVGHYHTPYEYRRPDGCALHVVPAWCEGEEIGVVDRKTGGVQFGPWQTLIG